MVARIFTRSDQQSHFEDIELSFKPQGHMESTEFQSATGVAFRRVLPGQVLNWHPAPRRQFVIILQASSRSASATARSRSTAWATRGSSRTRRARGTPRASSGTRRSSPPRFHSHNSEVKGMPKILHSPKQPDVILDIAKSLTPPGFELVVADPGTPEFYAAAADADWWAPGRSPSKAGPNAPSSSPIGTWTSRSSSRTDGSSNRRRKPTGSSTRRRRARPSFCRPE